MHITNKETIMIKKITLASVATMALLFIPAQAENTKCQAGKCGAGMMQDKGMMKGKTNKMGKKCNTMRQGSPLLLRLPSPMRMIMMNEADPKLALTADQKSKLEAQRNEMMPKMMKLKEEISALSKEIKQGCKKDVSVADQKAKVEKLATLKTDATMMKLTCIAKVKTILSKEQHAYLKEMRDARMAKRKEKMQAMRGKMGMNGQKGQKGQMGTMKKEMKCQAGKCAGNAK